MAGQARHRSEVKPNSNSRSLNAISPPESRVKQPQSTMKICRTKTNRCAVSLLSACALLFSGTKSVAADGVWSTDSSGNWSDTTKWAGGVVADGADSTAYFTNDITTIRTVTLDT